MQFQNLTYKKLYNKFQWDIPKYYNIGYDICEKWANKTPNRTAIIDLPVSYTHLTLPTKRIV